jgi:hypothetical protein
MIFVAEFDQGGVEQRKLVDLEEPGSLGSQKTIGRFLPTRPRLFPCSDSLDLDHQFVMNSLCDFVISPDERRSQHFLARDDCV